jgi:hypothetical protein
MIAVTLDDNERAFVRSSSVAEVGAPFATCAKTQMLLSAMMILL